MTDHPLNPQRRPEAPPEPVEGPVEGSETCSGSGIRNLLRLRNLKPVPVQESNATITVAIAGTLSNETTPADFRRFAAIAHPSGPEASGPAAQAHLYRAPGPGYGAQSK